MIIVPSTGLGYTLNASHSGGTGPSKSDYYDWYTSSSTTGTTTYTAHHYVLNEKISYSKGDFVSNVIAVNGTYTVGSSSAVNSDGYWYVRGSKLPKYTLYKYDKDLVLKSAYDVDTKTITTVPIDISNKGNNKLKLTLSTSGTNYKLYISNDNSTWQQVTGISSGTAKELNVDGWNNLYIKIETNTSRINSINVAYYKN